MLVKYNSDGGSYHDYYRVKTCALVSFGTFSFILVLLVSTIES